MDRRKSIGINFGGVSAGSSEAAIHLKTKPGSRKRPQTPAVVLTEWPKKKMKRVAGEKFF
jgi:hypothetical protein